MKIRVNNILGAKELALILIIYSNVCFYKLNTQALYLLMNVTTGILVFLTSRYRYIRVTKSVLWLTVVFGMFILYGTVFLQAGSFNWDRFVISYAQCILYYNIFSNLLFAENFEKKLATSFIITAFLCIGTMYFQEGNFLGREMRSVGSTLSGNVNTVGMALGVMSLFMAYYYGKSRKLYVLIAAVLVMAIMMLTGSKKTIVYIIANVFILYGFSKNKTNGKIAILSLLGILAYVVFGIDYFYDLLGSRIVDMLGQMGFGIQNAHYSHSTQVRIYMIQEAFDMWKQHPILGGGANYFLTHTKTYYEYSHCNVVEMLCTYGIVGTGMYYYPYFYYLYKYKIIKQIDEHLAYLGLVLVVLSLVVDWMAVTFSSFSTIYIPIILILILIEHSSQYEYVDNKVAARVGKAGEYIR